MPGMASEVCNSETFQCPLCSAIYKSSVALQAHAVCSHHVGFYTCAWCATLIENESKIHEHARTCTELAKRKEIAFEAFCITDRRCNMCESLFSSNVRAVAHYKEIHLHCNYICGLCAKYFLKKEKFDSHYSEEHSDNACNIYFATMAEISEDFEANPPHSRHDDHKADNRLISKTRSMMYDVRKKRCSHCQLTFTDITELQDHFLRQHRFELFKCKTCVFVTSIEDKLKHHKCWAMPSSSKGKKRRRLRSRLAKCRTSSSRNGPNSLLPNVNASSRPIDKHHHVIIRGMLQDFRAKRCVCCELTFTKSTNCHDHFSQQHQLRIWECKKCDLVTSVESKFKSHSCHPLQPTSPTQKQYHFKSKFFKRGNKISMMFDVRAMQCSRCELEFTSSDECYDHFLLKHQLKILTCEKCDFVTSVNRSLEMHACQTLQSTEASNGKISSDDRDGNDSLSHEPSTSEGATNPTDSRQTIAKAIPTIKSIDLSDSESETAPEMIPDEDKTMKIWNEIPAQKTSLDKPWKWMGSENYFLIYD